MTTPGTSEKMRQGASQISRDFDDETVPPISMHIININKLFLGTLKK